MLGVWLFLGWCVFMLICIVVIACFVGSDDDDYSSRRGHITGNFIDWMM